MILEEKILKKTSFDLRELKELVRNGEGKYIEFKLKANHPEKIIREAVAFANTDGGYLLIGVGDDKSIKGLKFADEDEYILRKTLGKNIFPIIEYDLERVRVENEREVLVFYIKKSETKPHFVVFEDNNIENKKAYIRVEDKSVQASREMREILKRSRNAKDMHIRYGDKERVLMQYLANNTHITVKVFAELAKIPLRIASNTLVFLVLANVLRVAPNEQEDLFSAI